MAVTRQAPCEPQPCRLQALRKTAKRRRRLHEALPGASAASPPSLGRGTRGAQNKANLPSPHPRPAYTRPAGLQNKANWCTAVLPCGRSAARFQNKANPQARPASLPIPVPVLSCLIQRPLRAWRRNKANRDTGGHPPPRPGPRRAPPSSLADERSRLQDNRSTPRSKAPPTRGAPCYPGA